MEAGDECIIGFAQYRKVLEKNLITIGVHTPEQLRKMGSKEAFIRIRLADPGACLHMLYGLQGAIEGIRDSTLSEETKQDLRQFYREMQGK